jgi:hypothetical protein
MDEIAQALDSRSDDELLRAYRDPEMDDDGCALTSIFHRHRDAVLQLLLDEGLANGEAEERIGMVFLRALNREHADEPLHDLLRMEAAEVVRDPDWRPF